MTDRPSVQHLAVQLNLRRGPVGSGDGVDNTALGGLLVDLACGAAGHCLRGRRAWRNPLIESFNGRPCERCPNVNWSLIHHRRARAVDTGELRQLGMKTRDQRQLDLLPAR